MFAALGSDSEEEAPPGAPSAKKSTAEPPRSQEEDAQLGRSTRPEDGADFSVKTKKKKKGKGGGKGYAGPRTVRCEPGTQAFADELLCNVSRCIDAALSPLKAHIVANIREFIGSQDPLAGQNLPLAFRTAIVARTLDDRWHAELHFRGPTKCFYEAVQTTGSVKTKSGFRQNAEIYQLEGFWRRGVGSIHLLWTKETCRHYEGATQSANETSREVQRGVELRCVEHSCGSVYLQGNAEGTGSDSTPGPTFWQARKGIQCVCGFPCCCSCGNR